MRQTRNPGLKKPEYMRFLETKIIARPRVLRALRSAATAQTDARSSSHRCSDPRAKTRAPASAQAARKLREFKPSEIAARAVDDARPEAR